MGPRPEPALRSWITRRRRVSVAVATSLALHVVTWVVFSRIRAPAPPPADRPVEIAFEVTSPPAPSAEVTPPPAADAPARRRRADDAGGRPRTAAPPAPRPAAPAAPGDMTSLGMRTPEPVLPRDSAGVLVPSADLLGRAGIDLGPPAGHLALAPGKKESAWARGMRQREREAAARAVVDAGKAPPEAFDLAREIKRRYEPTRQLVIDLARAHAGPSISTGRWLGRYLGGFVDRDPTEAGKPFEADAAFRRAIEGAKVEYAARVCLSFSPEGVPKAEVEGSSKIAELDRMAVELVTQAGTRRPGLGTAARACYRFSARLERVPPVPVFACGLNADLRPECIWPLKEIAQTNVVLDGVELQAQGPSAPSADAGR